MRIFHSLPILSTSITIGDSAPSITRVQQWAYNLSIHSWLHPVIPVPIPLLHSLQLTGDSIHHSKPKILGPQICGWSVHSQTPMPSQQQVCWCPHSPSTMVVLHVPKHKIITWLLLWVACSRPGARGIFLSRISFHREKQENPLSLCNQGPQHP